MGRSAKFAKRPTKAEKVSRQVNTPNSAVVSSSSTGPTRRRSLSPDLAPKSAIPLFNTSRKGSNAPIRPMTARLLARIEAEGEPMSLDSSAAATPTGRISPMQADTPEPSIHTHSSATWLEQFPRAAAAAQVKKRTHKDLSTGSSTAATKLKKAKETMALDQRKNDRKLGSGKGGDTFKLGVDYVALHEKRNGGDRFKKRLR